MIIKKSNIFVLGAIISLIFFVLAVSIANPDIDNSIEQPVTIIDKELAEKYFEINNQRTVLIKIFMSFELNYLHKGHDRIISANPCVHQETYRRIYNIELNKVKDVLDKHHGEIVTASKACIAKLMKAEVTNLTIEYRDIIDKGYNYKRLRVPEPAEQPMTPEEFEAWEKTLGLKGPEWTTLSFSDS